MENQLVCLDLANGKEQWRSKEGDPSFAGFVHRYRSTDGKLMVEGNRIVTTYVESQSSGDNKGTHLYVMGIDGLTGAVAFKVHAALAERALSSGGGLFSVLGKITAAAMTFGISAAADLLSPDIGFSNIGFDYGLVQEDGIVRVYVVTPAEMLNPDTRAEHGEGVCAVDIRSGKKLYGEYFAIAEGIKPEYLPLGLVSDGNNQVYFAGKKRVVGFNLSTGKRLWTLEEGLDGQPFDLGLVDGSLYVKLGKTLYSNSYREPRGGFWNTLSGTSQSEKFEINKEWSVDPFGIAAIDPANGKLLWCFEMDNDPSLAVGSLEDAGGGVIEKHLDFAEYYDQVNRVFYVSDLKNVFSLKAGPGGGKPVWTYSLSRNDLGTINVEKAYAIVQRHPMEFSQALRLSYSNNALIVFGPSGIAKINTAAGTTLWRNEWDFAWDDMQYYDQLPSEVLYCNKGTLERFDCRAGQVVWKMDVDKKSYFQTVRDRSMLIVWLGDEVYGLDLK
jgi:outer membrane protein assembly factor BamB